MDISPAASSVDVQVGKVREIGVVVSLVGVLCGLEAAGLTRLRGWCEIDPDRPYAVLFGAFVASWLVVREARGIGRRIALLCGSLVTACLFDPWFAAGSVAWVVAFHRVLFAGQRARPGRGLVFVLATFLVLGVVCSRDLFPGFLDSHREVSRWGYLFAVAYTFR